MSSPGAPYAPTNPARTRIAVVVSGWPRVSEVFAVQELLALHRSGMLAGIWATKGGDAGPRQPQSLELDPLVTFLPEGDTAHQAAAMADVMSRLPQPVTGVHGYFAHEPSAVAREVAGLTGLGYSFSMHALDARKVDPAVLAERADGAVEVICCNPDVRLHVAGGRREAALVRHGVDLQRFTPTTPRRARPQRRPVELLAVGRFVAKKGFGVLVDAMLDVDLQARLTVVGTGPLQDALCSRIRQQGLDARVRLVGPRTHATLPGMYARADIVVVPSVVDADGDRDGLPNVVLEAMASGRPVVASDVAAVGTAVRHGSTGYLVPPGAPWAITAAVNALVADPVRRRAMGLAARTVAENEFGLDSCTAAFCRTLEVAHA